MPGNEIEIQILVIPESVKKIPGRISRSEYELAWLAECVAPIGYTSYHVTQKPQRKDRLYRENTYELRFSKKPITVGQDKASDTSMHFFQILIRLALVPLKIV